MPEQVSLGNISEKDEKERRKKEEVNMTILGEIPRDWNCGLVENLFSLTNGSARENRSSSRNVSETDGEIDVYGANGKIAKYNGSNLDKGLVIGRVGTVGSVYEIDEPTWVSDNAIKAELDTKNNLKFLYYVMKRARLDSLANQTAHPLLNQSIVGSVRLPLPEFLEQRKIASVLYNVDQAIQKTEEIIEQTQRVKKGVMQDLFTEGYYKHEEFQETRLGPKKIEVPKEWKITRFSEVSEVQQGLQIAKSKRYKEDGENRYRYITVQHLKDPEDEKQRWFIEDPRERVICTEEDILMTRTGNTGQVVTDVEGAFHNNFFKVDFDRELLNKKFLVAYLRSEMVQNLLISYAGITTIPDLNHADFGRIPLLVPPKKEQEKIADSLISLEEKIEQEKEQKKQLQRLKKGLMQDLLTGEVRTKDKDIEVLDEVMEAEEQ